MKTIDVKVDTAFGNKIKLLKQKDNGSWNEVGRGISLKALHDGIESGKYNVLEWTDCASIMYREYQEKKLTPDGICSCLCLIF